jgi:hypothetical protein
MEPGFPRVEFEFDLDDLADVNVRAFLRTRFGRRATNNAGLAGAITFAVVLGVFASAYGSNVGLIAGAVGLIVGIPIGYLSRRAYVDVCRKRARRLLAEHLGDSARLRCEVELRPDGVWSRQRDVEVTTSWRNFVAADDVIDGIELRFTGGACVLIRNRAFATPDSRSAFLDRARELGAAA